MKCLQKVLEWFGKDKAPELVPDVPFGGLPPETPRGRKYPYKRALATVFWVGEPASADNGYISNHMSAWDNKWKEHFGGFDDPDKRQGYVPEAFMPKENPFYCALPYNDLDKDGTRKLSAQQVPWFKESKGLKSILKNRWVAIAANGKIAYAQWQDVGPFEEDDFNYVFGSAAEPKAKPPAGSYALVGAGLDLSPAVAEYLDIAGAEHVLWKHVDDADVPDGPWKLVVTTRNVSW